MSPPPRRPLILASGSARRRTILARMGVPFEVLVPDVAEVLHPADARRTALENAALKSAWCRARHPDRHSLAADTLIEFRGRTVTKARTRDEAVAFLRMFSGTTHTVFTAVALACPGAEPDLVLDAAEVRFRPLGEAAIADYLHRVNPMDRAGAYDIDETGEALIESHTGSRTTIMGLPAERILPWLRREGFLC